MTVVLLVLIIAVLMRLPSRSVDRRAGRLPRSSGLHRYTSGTGPVIGRVITGRLIGRSPVLHMTEEDQATVIAGPRTGKTTSFAIPAAVAHRARSGHQQQRESSTPSPAPVGIRSGLALRPAGAGRPPQAGLVGTR